MQKKLIVNINFLFFLNIIVYPKTYLSFFRYVINYIQTTSNYCNLYINYCTLSFTHTHIYNQLTNILSSYYFKLSIRAINNLKLSFLLSNGLFFAATGADFLSSSTTTIDFLFHICFGGFPYSCCASTKLVLFLCSTLFSCCCWPKSCHHGYFKFADFLCCYYHLSWFRRCYCSTL